MELPLAVIFVAFFTCSLLLLKFGKRLERFLHLTSKIPGPTLWQLVTVHAKHLLGDNMVTYAWKLSESYKYKPWGMWMCDLNYVIFASDCETVSAVYKSKCTTDKPELLYKQMSFYIGRGLLTMNGPEYALHRKVFGVGFRKSLMEWYLPRMSQPLSVFVDELRVKAGDGRDVDVRSVINWHTMACAIVSFTSVTHANAHRVMELCEVNLSRRMELIQIEAINPVYYCFLRLKWSNWRNKLSCITLKEEFDDILMEEKARFIRSASEDERDISQTMIQSYLKIEGDVGDEKFFAHGRILLVASFETTAFVVNTLLLLLALHQDVQQRVWDEIDAVLGKEGRPIEVQDLDRMEYVEMVIKETLRLFPAVPVLARSVRQETNINGIQAPEGSIVAVNLLALHRNPEYFRDPLKFNPDRFSPEAAECLRPYSYIPFSAGFRNCPGQLHSFVIMKLMVVHVMKIFKILPGRKLKCLDDIKYKLGFTMHLQESSLRFVDRSAGTANGVGGTNNAN